MTTDDIRTSSTARADLSAVLRNPIILHALLALEQDIGREDVPDTADALTSVRVLSRQQGERRMLDKLKELIVPLIPAEEEDYADYGTGLTAEEVKAATEAI